MLEEEFSGRARVLQRLLRGALAASLVLILSVAWNVPLVVLAYCAGAIVGLLAIRAFAGRLRRTPFLCTLLVLCVGLRAAWIALAPTEQTSDFAIYHELAVFLESAHAYAITGPVGTEDLSLYIGGPQRSLPYVTALRAPGVPLLHALVQAVSSPNPIAGMVLNVLLDAGSCCLLYLLLSRIGHEREGRLAALLWAVYPSTIASCSLVCTEVPIVFFLLLAAAALPRGAATTIRTFLHGIACGGLALIRPTILQVAVASIAALSHRAGRRLPLLLLVYGLGVAVPIVPWTVRNWRTFHAFVPVCTNVGILLGNHTQLLVPARIRRSAEWQAEIAAWNALPSEVERSREGARIGLANLSLALREGSDHCVGRLHQALQLGYSQDAFMLDYAPATRNELGRPESRLSGPAREALTRMFETFYLTILGLALLGVAGRNSGKFWDTRLSVFLGLYVLSMFGSSLVIPGISRYHHPQIAVFTLWAALGIGAAERGGTSVIAALRRYVGPRS